jgi:uncharacterized protein (TIGR02145 family)
MKNLFLHLTALLFIGSVNAQETVTIPCTCQVWDVKNLDVTKYRNGDDIPEVTDSIKWVKLTTGAWCYYNNDPTNNATYGKLYNWYAVNDPRGLAPAGYHIPSDAEWKTLSTAVGREAGNKMKEPGTTHWLTTNPRVTNSSGFTGLPGGVRYGHFPHIPPSFRKVNTVGFWWSFTESPHIAPHTLTHDYAGAWQLNNIGAGFYQYIQDKREGLSVRCIKDCH